MLDEIFGAFREARRQGSGRAFETLQDKLAEHASQLIGAGLSGVKELVDTLVRLDGVGKGDGDEGESNEARMQRFLRGSEADEEEVLQ